MPISLAERRSVISGAVARARELDIHISIAIVDEGGFLQSLDRMDGAPPLSAQIAEAKAVGAAVWHKSGDALEKLQSERPAFYHAVDRLARMPIMPGLGSVLITRGDTVLGAIGVSGAASHQDLECAETGLKAIQE